MSATDARTAAANTRLADQVESVCAGHLDCSKLAFAIAEGGDPAELLQETIERITALHDPDRLAAFSRSLAKQLRSASA